MDDDDDDVVSKELSSRAAAERRARVSIAMEAEEQERADWRGTSWALGRTLRFLDLSLESRYYHEAMDQSWLLAWRTFAFFSVLAAAEFANWRAGWLLSADEEDVVAAVARIFILALLVGCGALVRCRLLPTEAALLLVLSSLPPLILAADRYPVAILIGQAARMDDKVAHCYDRSELLLLLLLLCCVPGLVSGRFCWVWFVYPWSVLTLFFCSVTLTQSGATTVTTTVLVTVLHGAVVGVLACGHYRVELDRRSRFADNLKLRAEAANSRLELLKQQLWMADLEARVEAFRAADPSAAAVRFELEADGDSRAAPLVALAPCAVGHTLSRGPGAAEAPNSLLADAMADRDADPARLRRMALRIREPGYGMKEFFDDCVATFPELELFFVAEGTSSGRGAEVEYQRTLGALFAVYWLLRLPRGGDGKEGFCFGVDAAHARWKILKEPSDGSKKTVAKRLKFHAEMEWSLLEELTEQALEGNTARIEAMLCLTAFHDIMKVKALCPTVQQRTGPYRGYDVGDVISDHDVALAYVLERFPDLLPSFRILPAASREVVLFTQGRMQFNHGWFVQAEAPPGPTLRGLKAVLREQTRPADLAFYFFHWLTDLSGADGRPFAGAEKFVLNFPRQVLSAFIWSIPFLQRLTSHTETEVMEQYLEARFLEASPWLPLPEGPEAVAMLRLSVMAQAGGSLVPEAFEGLGLHPRLVLASELALTGLEGQRFGRSDAAGGPALLAYYGPALLQRCTTADAMKAALQALAALLSAGRRLWPLDAAAAGSCVTLDAAALKASAEEVLKGQLGAGGRLLILERGSALEGAVRLADGAELNALRRSGAPFTALEPAQCSDFQA